MILWEANLIFNDKIHEKKTKLKINFPPLHSYNCLYTNLKTYLTNIGWNPIDYPPTHIRFELASYMDEPVGIVDWNKYILNRDKINVIIFNPNKYYYGLFTAKEEKLMQATKAETIYNDIKIEYITGPLLLYKINEGGIKKLIDVIDNPRRVYNEVVNRLVRYRAY